MFLLGLLRTVPCISNGWSDPDRYEALCYSDIPILYTLRGLADGMVPYLEWPADGRPLEYPVLTGGLTYVSALLTDLLGLQGQAVAFYLVSMVLSLGLFLIALAATSITVTHRVWDGLLLALAPSIALAATINWDMLAVALTAVALWAWSRSRPWLAGVLLGLAIAAKFYPLLLLGPWALLALRRRRLGAFGKTVAGAAVAWLVVNLPVALVAPEGWAHFFAFSTERGADFGSLWLALSELGFGVPADALNLVAVVSLVLLCALIAALTLASSVPPRLAQVCFLVLAAFLITNKVYSPQFVLWLLPLAVLARPRWRDFLIWQTGEIVYFVAVWWYLAGFGEEASGLDSRWYAVAILIHVAGTGYLSALVVRDILAPRHDPVRATPPAASGQLWDDPGGGPLDGAPDRFADPQSKPITVSKRIVV